MSLDEANKRYPEIFKAFGRGWIAAEVRKPIDKRHALPIIMQRSVEVEPKIQALRTRLERAQTDAEKLNIPWVIELLATDSYVMNLLEFSLASLSGTTGFATLVKELKEDTKFLSSVSVATIACSFLSKGRVSLFPQFKLGTKKKVLDLVVELVSRPVYIEATTPRFPPCVYGAEKTAVLIKERASGQLLDEFKDNIEELVNKRAITNEPVLLVIDAHWTEIDSFSVELALYGPSMFQKYKGTDYISGVIIYKRAEVTDGTVRIYGAYLPNPKACNPMSQAELERAGFFVADNAS